MKSNCNGTRSQDLSLRIDPRRIHGKRGFRCQFLLLCLWMLLEPAADAEEMVLHPHHSPFHHLEFPGFQPSWEQAKVHYLFIPKGFDDNDEVEAVIDGYLPNGCYKVLEPIVTIDLNRAKVLIEPRAQFDNQPNIPCLEALVPYFVILRFGKLPVGKYTIEVNQSKVAPTQPMIQYLTIEPAKTPTQDNHIYAPIDTAQVIRNTEGQQYIHLEGRFTNTCMEFKEAILENHGETLNLLPTIQVRQGSPASPCVNQEIYYTKHIPLPREITPGRHLLHVRSLNGTAFNVLFYVRPWD